MLTTLLLATLALAAPFTGGIGPGDQSEPLRQDWSWRAGIGAGAWLHTERAGDQVSFDLELNRGAPSYNSGVMSGEFRLDGHLGIFHPPEREDCIMLFVFVGDTVQIKQIGSPPQCGFGFGVRADHVLALVEPAGAPPDDGAQVLATDRYTLRMWSLCAEGEVGCQDLTGQLVDNATGRTTELSGSTYMVKCADGTTPCHVGFHDLRSGKVSVRAYPDGTLEVEGAESAPMTEHGTWN